MRHYASMRKQYRDEAGTGILPSFCGCYSPFNYDACLHLCAHTCMRERMQACRHFVATLQREPEHCKTVNQCLDLLLSLERQCIRTLHGAPSPLAVAIS